MALKLYIKQGISYNIIGQPIIYVGTNPQSLTPVIGGTLATNRQWPNFGTYIDVTNEVSDLTNLTLTWTEQRTPDGVTSPGTTQNRKSASGKLTFEGEAYRLIKQWLINDVSGPLNNIAVKVQDTNCGTYEDYMIKASDVTWCEEGVDSVNLCVFDVTLKKHEDPLTCFQRTAIADNWQGWFSADTLHKHPRFSYCNEQRPNGNMVVLWWIMAVCMAPLLLVMLILMTIINLIVAVLNAIIYAVNLIIALVGGTDLSEVDFETIPFMDYQGLFDGIGAYFIEAAGCGREHPAPLIRDYIINVCKKCKIDVDGVSAPIFFAKNMPVETSGRGVINTHNPHYRACYLNAPIERGVRRFESIGIFTQTPNTTDYYVPDNRPLLTGSEFLDELKLLYNAEWNISIVNGKPTLFFQRKDFFLQGNYILDFTTGEDRAKLLQGICFEWDTIKYPASTEGVYSDDPIDMCGNNALKYMNSVVSFDPTELNPVFDGKRDKFSHFGATKFRLDGASMDYLYDAFQVVVNGSFLTPYVAGFMFDFVGVYIQEFADYALLMADETCSLPKVLIWGGGDQYENARATMPYTGYPVISTFVPMPAINGKYNAVPWHVRHPNEKDCKVRGSSLTLPPFYPGFYTVTDFFGAREIKQPVRLVNYPMYFEEGYLDTLWDWFHWIDDPRLNPRMNHTWTATLELCCDTIRDLGLVDGATPQLSGKVKLPLQYYTDGRITEIEVNYSVEPPFGQHILIKGNV